MRKISFIVFLLASPTGLAAQMTDAEKDAWHNSFNKPDQVQQEIVTDPADSAKHRKINKMKRKTIFKSYEDAGKFFDGTLRNIDDFGWGTGSFVGRIKYLGPLGTDSKIRVRVSKVLQIIDQDTIMLVAPTQLATIGLSNHREIGSSTWATYGRINPLFKGSRNLNEDQCYIYISEQTGTHKYTTNRGFTKTVPAVFIYAIGALGEGMTGVEGVDYQCW